MPQPHLRFRPFKGFWRGEGGGCLGRWLGVVDPAALVGVAAIVGDRVGVEVSHSGTWIWHKQALQEAVSLHHKILNPKPQKVYFGCQKTAER
jgi:hypothetical protein